MPHQFMNIRRTTGSTLAGVLAATLSMMTLSGCQGLLSQEKMLPASQLKSELVTGPAGSKPFSRGTLSPDGVLTVNQFVDGVFNPEDQSNEKTRVAGDGFNYAVQANWSAPDGTQADVFLIQFSGSAGAQDFVADVSEGTSRKGKPQEPLSSLDGIPEGEAWTAGAVDGNGDISQIAWFAVGNIVADLHYYTPGAPNASGLAQLAQAQYARLTGNVTTPSPLPSSAVAAPAPAGTAPAPTSPADQSRLQGDLVTPPDGSKPWPSNGQNGPTGVLTLQQFVARFASQTDQQLVTNEQIDRGFQYAVREDWNADSGSEGWRPAEWCSRDLGVTPGHEGAIAQLSE
ncbi:hypothetical protein [Kitasatospora paracochleata]|uniref:Uncharacterized protein n=1 Tax=Kitasatospora paracochleata TaxID=58354 RepID=A0ABT1J9U0_9ACTN|nr:hypothetical protein [Kitasatospora paracochleata]MCP2313969.1 hypothetical protein [Kitasatospora paracochleata]